MINGRAYIGSAINFSRRIGEQGEFVFAVKNKKIISQI